MHNDHVLDGINSDLTNERDRDYYLDLAGDWKDPFGLPTITIEDDFHVVRDDLIGVGSKGRFADLYLQKEEADHYVYVAPRVGFAGISLARMTSLRGKKLTLFCPASKWPSDHQMIARELGAKLKFVRVAAMPNLNKIAQQWAVNNGATFVPFGLRNKYVTAAIVNTCQRLTEAHGEPGIVWSAVSTGVLTRGLQIGWPNARFYGVAVARNLHAGEAGRAEIFSYPKAFHWETKTPMPFGSVRTYDAKAFEIMRESYKAGDDYNISKILFWNVAADMKPKDPCVKINSARDWGDTSDILS